MQRAVLSFPATGLIGFGSIFTGGLAHLTGNASCTRRHEARSELFQCLRILDYVGRVRQLAVMFGMNRNWDGEVEADEIEARYGRHKSWTELVLALALLSEESHRVKDP